MSESENAKVGRPLLPTKPTHHGQWVQTEREAHEAWAELIRKSSKAAQLMHILTARVGEHNAVVVSQRVLQELMRCSRPTIQRALKVLSEDRWIDVRQIGDRGTVNAYVLNDRVVWNGPRERIRYSLFSATVVLSSEEQTDSNELDHLPPLRRLPLTGETQMPSGSGLPPVSQPSFDGFEPDLPAIPGQDPEV